MKKTVGFLMCLAAAGMLAGCGGKTDAGTSATTAAGGGTETTAQGESKAEAAGEPVVNRA